jgi:hypothetical protein
MRASSGFEKQCVAPVAGRPHKCGRVGGQRVRDCIALVLKSVLPCNCAMRNIKSALGLAAAISLALAAVAPAGDAKFRADGTIQRMSDTMVLVHTPAQDIEITRDAKTKITGELRRGAPVTVIYTKVSGAPYATEIIMGGAAKPK